MTAVLPNNAYYVSLDGSRRVTQRTRAHIKPIAIFPLHVDDAFCGKPLPGASSDAPVVARRFLQVPVAADHPVDEETPPLEPANAPPFNNDGPVVKIKRVVDRAPARPSSSSPVARRRGRPRLPASVSQPAPRTPLPSRFAPPVDEVAPKRRRGRPRKEPAPQPVAEYVVPADTESAEDTSSGPSTAVRPPAPSADPALQPRVSLRCLDPALLRPETRQGGPPDADGHAPDQPEAARSRAVTRSGRVTRPPLFYGLGGDAAY